jgi:Predicted AAA-ATPase/PD-(D/E)XK nuclease superfamily
LFLLIDEYDRPLVKHLGDVQLANELRDVLQDLFATIKSVQSKLKFVFVTGVSKFSKVSLFSAMNSLDDISLDPTYATLVGMTEKELRLTFADQLARVAKLRNLTTDQFVDLMREWYNGYLFTYYPAEGARVYNPWSVFKSLKCGVIDNYWFDTGTPTFAVELIRDRLFPITDFEKGVAVGSNLNMSIDPASIDLATLLYQTGYLTIDSYDEEAYLFWLKVPNEEMRRSMVDHLFGAYTGQETWQAGRFVEEMRSALQLGDMNAFFDTFNTLLASIPYPLHIKQESYYHSLIYLAVRLLGFSVQAEVTTSRGRVDLLVERDNAVYLFEFKIDSSAEKALQQIRDNDYARRFESTGKPIHLIGASFNTKTRLIDDWKETSWSKYLELVTS